MIKSACTWKTLACLSLIVLLAAGTALADTVGIRFYSQGLLTAVQSPVPDGMSRPEAAVRALVAGPTAIQSGMGFSTAIPAGVSINSLTIDGDAAAIDLSAGVTGGLSEASLVKIVDQFRSTLGDFPEIMTIKLTSGGKTLASYLPPVGAIPHLPAVQSEQVATNGVGLAGKKIGIGQSHGRFWNGSGWYWQRALTCGWGELALEDLLSQKLCAILRQYLEQDGATVIHPRQYDTSDCCNSDTGLPWYEMCAESWLHHAGAPSSVWANYSGDTGPDTDCDRSSDDVRARPLWADYNNTDIYIACHTNAGGTGNATGTEVYHDSMMEHPTWIDSSTSLATNLQNSIVSSIRSTFDEEPAWSSRGVKDSAAGFGEIRVPDRPAALIELAFHDDCTRDALYLTQDDFFKSVAEWGVYNGICAYFGNTPTWDKYSCEYVSDTIPTTMVPKQVYNCSVTLRNRGVCWYSTRGFKLAATANNDAWFKSVSSVNSPDGIKPGDTATINFQLTGPCVGGSRKTEWRMVRTGFSTGFGPTVTKTVDAGTVVDTDPPTVPGNLRMTTRSTTTISLAWDASTDVVTEVSGYTVYRNGVAIATITGTTYTDTGRTQDTSYTYEVDAFDAFNNRSAKCTALVASTLPDSDPPTVPLNLRKTSVVYNSVALAWDASADNIAVTGYTVYRNGASIGTTAAATYNDTTAAQSTTYVYTVDAYDQAGNHSAQSSSVSASTPILAAWGPYNLSQSQTIMAYTSPYYQLSNLRTGWYSGAAATNDYARCLFKAPDANMATMPAQALCAGGSCTMYLMNAGTYSSSSYKNNIYRVTKNWTRGTATTWTAPWTTAGGDYVTVGTTSIGCGNTDKTALTFTPTGTNAWFPYGVMLKSDIETTISYRKAWYASGTGTTPTLTVNYVPPTPTIRSWAYLGNYAQGVAADHATRIGTDHVAATYGGIPITEANIAPGAADGASGPSYGNSYGTFKWKSATATDDIVSLLTAPFYNLSAKDNGTTYAAVYVYNANATNSAAYMGFGSDDDDKVYLNGTLVGSFLGTGRGAVADQDFYGPMTINSGWNRLLVKVENGTGGYGLYARFCNIDRSSIGGLTTYTSDATAPTSPTACTEAGGAANNVWQQTVSAPSFSWSGSSDPQGTGEGVSGLRGYKVYFGADPAGVPAAFQTGTTYAPGTQADGAYYLRVSAVDFALNESAPVTLYAFKKNTLVPGAKALGNAAAVVVAPEVVTAAVDGGFYMEETDRSAGIKVAWTGNTVNVGDIVNVVGSLATDANSERVITASLVTASGTDTIAPFSLTNKAIGGGDWSYNASTGAGQKGVIDGVGLNNIGLLVRTNGYVAAVGSDYIIINDGSEARGGYVVNGVRISCPGLIKPMIGQHVMVTGISTIHNVRGNLYRCVLVTTQDGISLVE